MAIIKLLYSIEPKGRICVKGYGFLSIAKHLTGKYSQKIFDSAKKSAADAIKAASKRSVQKLAEATGYLIGKESADQITKAKQKTQDIINNYQKKDIYRIKKAINC